MPSRLPGFFDDDAEEELEGVDSTEEDDDEAEPVSTGKEDTLEIEIVDDPAASKWRTDPAEKLRSDPENDKDFGKRVQKRINTVTAAGNEAIRQRDQERREKAEIIAVAQAKIAENEELRRQIAEGKAQRYSSEAKGAETDATLATSDYKLAIANGDAGAAGDANSRIADAKARALQAKRDAEKYTADAEEAKGKVTTAVQKANEAVQISKQADAPSMPAARINWFSKNSWFNAEGTDAKSRYAITIDAELREAGVEVDSPAYFKGIDKAMRDRYPKDFGVVEKTERRSGTVRAERAPREESQRTNPMQGNKLNFTKSQLNTASSLGLCKPEEVKTGKYSDKSRAALVNYAKEIARANEDKD